MSHLDTFQESLNSLIVKSILVPVVDYLKSKDVDVTLEELTSALNITGEARRPAPKSKPPSPGRCVYTPGKGNNKGIPCGKPVVEGEEHCKTCLKKPAVQKNKAQAAQSKAPILSKMPQILAKDEDDGDKATPVKTLPTPLKLSSFPKAPLNDDHDPEGDHPGGDDPSPPKDTDPGEKDEDVPTALKKLSLPNGFNKLGGLKSLPPLGKGLPPLGLKA